MPLLVKVQLGLGLVLKAHVFGIATGFNRDVTPGAEAERIKVSWHVSLSNRAKQKIQEVATYASAVWWNTVRSNCPLTGCERRLKRKASLRQPPSQLVVG